MHWTVYSEKAGDNHYCMHFPQPCTFLDVFSLPKIFHFQLEREQNSVTSGKWLFLTLSCVTEKEKVQTVDFCIPRKGFLKDLGINLFLSFFLNFSTW